LKSLAHRVGVVTGGPDMEVSIDDAGSATHLVFRQGCLWAVTTRQQHADVYLRSERLGLVDCLLGTRAIEPYEVEARIDGWQFAPIHPFDCGPQDADAATAVTVNLTVQHAQYDSLVGDIYFVDHFSGGLLTERAPGITHRADVIVQNTYRNAVRSNTPEIPLLEAAAGARVSARHTPTLLTVATLYDNPALRKHLDRRRAVSDALIQLGGHVRHHAWLGVL